MHADLLSSVLDFPGLLAGQASAVTRLLVS